MPRPGVSSHAIHLNHSSSSCRLSVQLFLVLDPMVHSPPLARQPHSPPSPTPCSVSLLARASSNASNLSFVVSLVFLVTFRLLRRPFCDRWLLMFPFNPGFPLRVTHYRSCAATGARTPARRFLTVVFAWLVEGGKVLQERHIKSGNKQSVVAVSEQVNCATAQRTSCGNSLVFPRGDFSMSLLQSDL